jgi:hypothetical protein
MELAAVALSLKAIPAGPPLPSPRNHVPVLSTRSLSDPSVRRHPSPALLGWAVKPGRSLSTPLGIGYTAGFDVHPQSPL